MTIIFLILYYSYKRNKQAYAQFEEIIKKIEQQNSQNKSLIFEFQELNIPNISNENKIPEKKQKLISDNKEAMLLKRLKDFETGKEFTSQNFNSSNLATILDTNIKYTNYILKEHRGKNFNEYINGLRIDFLIKLLYNEPQHLNYKINYLSELVGFSSHSHFTQVFKKELKISPSEFISKLSRNKRNN